jgi:hypothetical protein
MNTADTGSGPADPNVVVMVATPLALTGTGEWMTVPPTSNRTDPAGWVPSAATTVAVIVTGFPAVAGAGAAVSVVVVGTAGVPPVPPP